MTDRELLELAAKAVGATLEWLEVPEGDPDCDAGWYCMKADTRRIWNPLTDDGDALRLAVALHLLILPYPNDNAVRVTRLDQPGTIVSYGTPPDPLAATRRAITRAAAVIGASK